jgi:hypothetical protein
MDENELQYLNMLQEDASMVFFLQVKEDEMIKLPSFL